MTVYAGVYFFALYGLSLFAIGRLLGRRERFRQGVRAGLRDGEMGALARASRLPHSAATATAVAALPPPVHVEPEDHRPAHRRQRLPLSVARRAIAAGAAHPSPAE